MRANPNIPFVFTQLNDLELEEKLDILELLVGTPLEEEFNQHPEKSLLPDLQTILQLESREKVEKTVKVIFNRILGFGVRNPGFATVEEAFYHPLLEPCFNKLLENRVKDQFLLNLSQAYTHAALDGIPASFVLNEDYSFSAYTETEEGEGTDWDWDFSMEDITVTYNRDTYEWKVEEDGQVTTILLLAPVKNVFAETKTQTRETALAYLSNEDIEMVGYDPAKVSDEAYEEIVEDMKECFDDSFQVFLLDSLNNRAPGAKKK